jgi:MFS superfamily sulfate permease-like transporter
MLCGLVGALPMTGVIVRSSANVQAGATTRLSAMFHGLWLLAFVLLLSSVLQSIPVASLAGVLVYTGIKLVDLKAFKAWAVMGGCRCSPMPPRRWRSSSPTC